MKIAISKWFYLICQSFNGLFYSMEHYLGGGNSCPRFNLVKTAATVCLTFSGLISKCLAVDLTSPIQK
jgi:hypothetical protein